MMYKLLLLLLLDHQGLKERLTTSLELKGKEEPLSLFVVLPFLPSASKEEAVIRHQLEQAKEAASSTVDLLENTDQIGVVAFDDTYSWVVPLQIARDNEEIKKQIAGITIGGGTSIYPAVNVAAEDLKKYKSD